MLVSVKVQGSLLIIVPIGVCNASMVVSSCSADDN